MKDFKGQDCGIKGCLIHGKLIWIQQVYSHYLNFVVFVGSATVELQLGIRVITLIVFTHPGNKGEVFVVLHPECPREQEVHKATVFEGETEVVQVSKDKGVRLNRWGLNDAVENHPLSIVLEDAGGYQLGAVMAAVPFTNLRQNRPLRHS